MKEAEALAADALNWLRDHYVDFHFFAERDLVFTFQTCLVELERRRAAGYRIFNDHPISVGGRRRHDADIVIVSPDDVIGTAIAFSYEPDHSRTDLLPTRFPLVAWDAGVGADVRWMQELVARGSVSVGWSVFVDEGGHYRDREPHPGSQWIAWGKGVWILYSRAAR